jgi:hypothetical protein
LHTIFPDTNSPARQNDINKTKEPTIEMKFFLTDENHNAYEYTVPSTEKGKVLYDLLESDLDEFYSKNFYIYSPDLEVKINVEYPMYKYFGTSENILVELEIKSFQKAEIFKDDEISQSDEVNENYEGDGIEDLTDDELSEVNSEEFEEHYEVSEEVCRQLSNVILHFEKKIYFLQLMITLLAFVLLFK